MSGPKALGGGWAIPVVNKVSAYTVVAGDCGKMFTITGATGGVTFTLPKTSTVLNGWWCEFGVTVAQVLTITAGTTDTLITVGDVASKSLAFTGTIGQHAKVICTGTGYFVVPTVTAASAATDAFAAVTVTS